MPKKACEKGIILYDRCQAKHMIADHLGWFDTVKKERYDLRLSFKCAVETAMGISLCG
ncbi:hypothetical protein CcCBS67573_g07064 [Chytriomyces confervae]|uniref:DNL-type domain-containing protein n=1 Tax=Chytriomyces confervae TaxID=246404 RepID=A0A507EY07_9FUNG|nr:hypothetical protein CcCBS67573_g07064 [Chytriomyces confervae]